MPSSSSAALTLPTASTAASPFSLLSDDLLLLILSKLQREPHIWPRLCCVSPRFSSLILSSCYPSWCLRSVHPALLPTHDPAALFKLSLCCPGLLLSSAPHRSPRPWSPSREEGAKLLASRFRADRLYVSSWPGCPHFLQGRYYMLFRGLFPEFRRTALHRSVEGAARAGPRCAFCTCACTWDLNALFCLRGAFACRGDEEPAVLAYVCENGHVAGSWRERPRYS